ncbi:hypothetical protein BCV69DRAFT_310111 [Microstroma glucosiphilum]|uniref:Uncharacterized protein n=1 Tax=Pseudomicrostroma glucosiphilum TaxID=1684307 RepID=A0A316UHA3_9BASI|nr:hypothetical protein BCV69DRAFT_310111 [Pseudomicrostroma glucosiphilum]PWN24284.1 hypothetical protein BCV69DRAFT_310111 [Pseudomicrostroma glucosiphilum]
MSTRDRFLSSLSTAQDDFFKAVNQHIAAARSGGNPDSSAQGSGSNAPTPAAAAASSSSSTHPGSTAPLPTYAPQPSSGAPRVPEAVLRAPPGQAQQAIDSNPRSRLENPHLPEQERRRAAEQMRKEQEMLHRTATQHSQQQQQSQPSQLRPLPGAGGAALRAQKELARGLKRTHSYAANNGKVVVDLFTQPQRSPTFMGGSAERGRGAMNGQVVVFANDGDRVGAVRLKIKAVSTISVPRSYLPPSEDPNKRSAGAMPSNTPVNLVGRSPRSEPTQNREHLILQLERVLWNPEAADQSMVLRSTDTANGPPKEPDPTIWKAGRHAFPFKIDLPSKSQDGTDLPPSFVFLADARANGPATQASVNTGGQLGGHLLAAKKWLAEAAVGGLRDGEWASIKWYVKVTVERPGFLKSNDRVFVPFVYLPSPPAKLPSTVLPNRLRLSAQARQDPLTPGAKMVEPIATWGRSQLDLDPAAKNIKGAKAKQAAVASSSEKSNGSSLFSRMFKTPIVANGTKVEPGQPAWSIAMPNEPSIWPLRSTIPFEIRLDNASPSSMQQPIQPPSVGLFLRVTLINPSKSFLGGKNIPSSAIETRLISVAKVFTDPNAAAGRGNTLVWRGLLDLPPQASPCFDSLLTQAEYFVAVEGPTTSGNSAAARLGGMGGSGRLIWAQTIILVCPLPLAVKPVRPVKGSTRARRAIQRRARPRPSRGPSPTGFVAGAPPARYVSEKEKYSGRPGPHEQQEVQPGSGGSGSDDGLGGPTGALPPQASTGRPLRPSASRRTSSHATAAGKSRQFSSTSNSKEEHRAQAIASAHALGYPESPGETTVVGRKSRTGEPRQLPPNGSRRSSAAPSITSSSGHSSSQHAAAAAAAGGSRRPSATALGMTPNAVTASGSGSGNGGPGYAYGASGSAFMPFDASPFRNEKRDEKRASASAVPYDGGGGGGGSGGYREKLGGPRRGSYPPEELFARPRRTDSPVGMPAATAPPRRNRAPSERGWEERDRDRDRDRERERDRKREQEREGLSLSRPTSPRADPSPPLPHGAAAAPRPTRGTMGSRRSSARVPSRPVSPTSPSPPPPPPHGHAMLPPPPQHHSRPPAVTQSHTHTHTSARPSRRGYTSSSTTAAAGVGTGTGTGAGMEGTPSASRTSSFRSRTERSASASASTRGTGTVAAGPAHVPSSRRTGTGTGMGRSARRARAPSESSLSPSEGEDERQQQVGRGSEVDYSSEGEGEAEEEEPEVDDEAWDFDAASRAALGEDGEIFADDLDGEGLDGGMDLPPSYFEATGMRDED